MENTQIFRNCIGSAAKGTPPSSTEISVLQQVVTKHPWFTTGQILLCLATGEEDELLKLHFSAYPRPAMLLEEVSLDDLGIEPRTQKSRSGVENPLDPLIDRFLEKGEYRIIPDESTPEDDVAAESGSLDTSDDLVSEELAGIYLAQGLNRQAKEIYERLSLLNPEKSIYFAEIIEGIDCGGPR